MQDGGNNALSTNYYKDLWNNPNTEAGQFFNKVDFNHKDYKDQEQVFRNFLKGLNRLKEVHEDQKPIETVLEVGAGKGRITNIVLEELKDIELYSIIDIKAPHKELVDLFPRNITVKIGEFDITGQEFDHFYTNDEYDLILCSEVLMHIKPEDIESVLTRLTKLLAPQGVICNIDWASSPEPSEWCYIHDYDKMYRENGLFPVFMMDIPEIKQKLFCYGK
jgi:2-polyprenyl-3-methyl-5-hydroxy-6-metoxy-1,4-benzoquinol methylase